jgi:hypothetical protein
MARHNFLAKEGDETPTLVKHIANDGPGRDGFDNEVVVSPASLVLAPMYVPPGVTMLTCLKINLINQNRENT